MLFCSAIFLKASNDSSYIFSPSFITASESTVFSTSEILQSTNIDPPDEATNMNIFQLFSHAHQLMTRFDILIQHPNGDEELIYTALDYEHPPILNLDPPLVISSGQNIIAKATYYNNTDDWVNFGLFSTDEMMLVFGLVYFD